MRNLGNSNKKNTYIGKEYYSKDGKLIRIIDYIDSSHATIEFVDSGYKLTTSIYRIKNNMVNSPFINSIIAFDTLEQERIGCKFNINGEIIEIIDINPDNTLRYKIHDWYGYEGNTTYNILRNGKGIYNPYRLNKAGCYYGEATFYRTSEYNEFILHKWHAIIGRGTGLNRLYNYSSNVSIRKCIYTRVCDFWRNFQNFAFWFDQSYSIMNKSDNIQYDIDKDLMYPFYRHQSSDLKLYSPVTCELLPHDLNVLIYDSNRKINNNIKSNILLLADKYINENKITQRAYDAIQIIYNDNKNINISIDIITPGYNNYLPRLDDNVIKN